MPEASATTEARHDSHNIDSEELVDIDVIELKLPCRAFRIDYKLAEPGEFSLTTEFMLRLLRYADGLSEAAISEFFAFTTDETCFVVDLVQKDGFARRKNGKVYLSEAGHRLFTNSDDPGLFEVHKKQERFDFDLLAFAPADRKSLDEFEFRLPEISMGDVSENERVADLARESFRRFFHEFRIKKGGKAFEAETLYTIDNVQAEQRFSALVPVTLAVRPDDPRFPEANMTGWRSGTELEDRAEVAVQCATFAKNITTRSDQIWSETVKLLSDVAPIQMMGAYNANTFKARVFFKAALKQAGELRVDRPTIRTVGHLWTQRNRIRFASAVKYALSNSAGAPPYQFWLRPSIPYWGITKRLSAITEAVRNQFLESSEDIPLIHSIMIGDDRRSDLFKHACDGCISLPDYALPAAIEAFLVPNHIAYVAVNAPMDSEEGYPIPLGILTFDPASVTKVQRFLETILESRVAYESHCSWRPNGLMDEVRAWLRKSPDAPTGN